MASPAAPHSLSRRDFLRCTAAGSAASVLVPGVLRAAAQPARRPNLLVVVADDMGFSDAGCYGGEIATPNLDALAGGGVRFTQAYSTGRCWPSRACILTGYYAQQVRMDPPKGRLPAWTRVLPHYLKPLGYRCYHSGKWHLNGAPKAVADGGFDHSYKLDDHNRFFAPRNHQEDDVPLPPVEKGSDHYATTHIAERALAYLREHARDHRDKPFLLYLAFTCPHFPLHAPAADIARYAGRYLEGWDRVRRRRWERLRQAGMVSCALPRLFTETIPSWNLAEDKLREQIGPGEAGRAVPWDSLTREQMEFQAAKMAVHAAMVDRMDQEIGRVLKALRELGMADDTATFFVSDNGASAEQIIRGDRHDPKAAPGSGESYLCLGPGWSSASNSPFRLHKSWNYEGGIASPLIVHWPNGGLPAGQLRHTPAHFIDLLPTLLELADGEFAPAWNGNVTPALPGHSLVPAFRQDTHIPREFLYWHHGQNRAIRVDNWKLAAGVAGKAPGPWELYDLQTDRCEMVDLASRDPDRVARMAGLWERSEEEYRRLADTP
ncbi:MAG: sulfatase-like hydrolase/transferase [Lentisphaeria bacterium]|nr:sulfatase-like hydrolase/transferase [Lentisphaeria bacterium]